MTDTHRTNEENEPRSLTSEENSILQEMRKRNSKKMIIMTPEEVAAKDATIKRLERELEQSKKLIEWHKQDTSDAMKWKRELESENATLKRELKEAWMNIEREDEIKRQALKDKYELLDQVEQLKKYLAERNSVPEWQRVKALEAERNKLKKENATLRQRLEEAREVIGAYLFATNSWANEKAKSFLSRTEGGKE